MSKVLDFLKSAGTFYYATAEDNKPKVRPFGFCMEFEGKVYVAMGKHKNCYKQTIANPNIQICACNAERQWIRVIAKAVPDDRPEATEKAFEVSPGLRNIYSEQSGFTLGLFYLTEGTAEFSGVGSGVEVIEF